MQHYFVCTCAYKTGAASMNEIIIVGQDEGAPLLHLQAVVAAGDPLAAVDLGGLEVLRTQPLLINHLDETQKGERTGEKRRRRRRRRKRGGGGGGGEREGEERNIMSLGGVSLKDAFVQSYVSVCVCVRPA